MPGEPLFLPQLPNDQSPEAVDEVRAFARRVIAEGRQNAVAANQAVRQSRTLLTVMYVGLFGIGFIAAAAAVYKGIVADSGGEAAGAAVIGGLSAASFFSFFLARPLESLERNSIYSQWLAAAVNSYWTRLAYLDDPDTIGADLEDATRDLIRDLRGLANQHAAAISKAAVPAGPAPPAPPPPPSPPPTPPPPTKPPKP